MSGETWRLFVGIFPPKEVAEAVGERIGRWRAEVDRGVSWVRPEKVHLTLCFLGEVSLEKVEELASSLRRVRFEPFALELAGLGCFPDARRPRVVWMGLGGEIEKLLALQQIVQEACLPFVERREDKPFAPHLTLARVKGPLRGLQGGLAKDAATQMGSWRVDEVRLVRSDLGREGGYTVLERLTSQG